MVTSDQPRVTTAPNSWADPTIAVPRASWWRRALPLVAWMTCLVVAVVLLRVLGAGRLAAPPLTDPGAWGTWATGRDPLEVVMVILRLLALGLAWYLTGVTSISVVARLLRAASLVRVADALSFGPVKVLVQQAVGIGLAASVLATTVPAAPGPARSDGAAASGPAAEVALLAPLPVTAGPTATDASAAPASAAVALRAQEPVTASRPETIVPVPAPTADVPAPAPAPAAAADELPGASGPVADASEPASEAPAAAGPAAPREVRVEPGDHFWALAEADVARYLGRPGTDAEVIAHWQAILEANADRLSVPGNPDVLLPGQMVLLPSAAEVRA